jgi:hypothetical protein
MPERCASAASDHIRRQPRPVNGGCVLAPPDRRLTNKALRLNLVHKWYVGGARWPGHAHCGSMTWQCVNVPPMASRWHHSY